jgi:hypothetical protein
MDRQRFQIAVPDKIDMVMDVGQISLVIGVQLNSGAHQGEKRAAHQNVQQHPPGQSRVFKQSELFQEKGTGAQFFRCHCRLSLQSSRP